MFRIKQILSIAFNAWVGQRNPGGCFSIRFHIDQIGSFLRGQQSSKGGGGGGETLWLCHCSGESFDDSTTLALSGVTLKEFQNDIKRISVW